MKKQIQIALITISAIIFLLGLCYIGLAVYYENGFSYGTYINGIYCTGKNIEEVDQELNNAFTYEGLSIQFPDKTEKISAEEIVYEYDFLKPLTVCLDRQNPFLWIENMFRGSQGITLLPAGKYDKEKLTEICRQMIAENTPEDETVSIRMGSNGYELLDTKKASLDDKRFQSLVETALNNGESELNLLEAGGYKSLSYTAKEQELIDRYSVIDAFLQKEILLHFGDEILWVTRKELSEMLLKDEEGLPGTDKAGNLLIDESALTEILDKIYDPYNTYRNHHFLTHDGNVIWIDTGSYGNEIDMKKEKAWFMEFLSSKENKGERTPVYKREAGLKGKNDIGDTYIEIDMTSQQMFYYEQGELILTTDVVTGNTSRKRGTPQMVCSVYGKQKNRVLKGPGYASFVNFWMPVSGNIGIHDASWRDTYGGEIYKSNGSHGCINTPYDKMAVLFEKVMVDTPVILYYQEEKQQSESA